MPRKVTYLNDALYEYLQVMSLREPPILQELHKVTAALASSQMQIAPEQGQFMALLIKLMGARRTIEVGVYTGYSSLAVALALPDDGQIIACDINEEWTAIAREYWRKANIAHKVDLRIAPANETLQELIDEGEIESFDFAFIDANKNGYIEYYEQCLRLIRQGGLILLDNTLREGKVADSNCDDRTTCAIRAINEKLKHDQRVDISLLPIGDGVTLARKK